MSSQVEADSDVGSAAEPDGSGRVLKMLAEGRIPARTYPRRRGWNGHYPDCPKPEMPRKTCRACRSEELHPG